MKSSIARISDEQMPKNMFCFSSSVFLPFLNTLGWKCLFRLAFYKLLDVEILVQTWKNCSEPYEPDNPQREEMLLKVSP